jgi:steroid 5-alpha reductase family enzyme
MDTFVAARKAHRTDAAVLDSGLWAWSRHPNYCGELLWWWGVYVFGARSAQWWVAVGPLALSALIRFVSIDLLEQRQLRNKGERYARYQRAVPSPLLLLPPALSRAIYA